MNNFTSLNTPPGLQDFFDSMSRANNLVPKMPSSFLAAKPAQQPLTGEIAVKKNRESDKAKAFNKESLQGPVASLLERIVDYEGVDKVQAMNYAFMYSHLAPAENKSPISIRRMKGFLEDVIKPSDVAGYNLLMKYYNIEAESLPKSKQKKTEKAVENVWRKFRTIENAFRYSQGFYDAAIQMAAKLNAPEEMPVVERVKWLRLWTVIIRDQSLFWGDMDSEEEAISKPNWIIFNQSYIYPEIMISIGSGYLSQLEDGSIHYDLLKEMINLFPEKVQNVVLRYAELDGKNEPDSTKVEYIRLLVKKPMFPVQWLAKSKFFCVTQMMKTFLPERIEKAVIAFRNGGIENMPTCKMKLYDPYNNCKPRMIKCYQYGVAIINGKERVLAVTCPEELAMYVVFYKWLLAHPDFTFGPENKTLSEYGLENLLPDAATEPAEAQPVNESLLEDVFQWILSMGYADRKSDINEEVAKRLLGREDTLQIFKQFAEGAISEDKIAEKYPFDSALLARACFSKQALHNFSQQVAAGLNSEFEKVLNQMGVALRNVQKFKVSAVNFRALVYFELYRYMKANYPKLVKRYNSYAKLL